MDFIVKEFDGLKFICGYLITLYSIILVLINYKIIYATKSLVWVWGVTVMVLEHRFKILQTYRFNLKIILEQECDHEEFQYQNYLTFHSVFLEACRNDCCTFYVFGLELQGYLKFVLMIPCCIAQRDGSTLHREWSIEYWGMVNTRPRSRRKRKNCYRRRGPQFDLSHRASLEGPSRYIWWCVFVRSFGCSLSWWRKVGLPFVLGQEFGPNFKGLPKVNGVPINH